MEEDMYQGNNFYQNQNYKFSFIKFIRYKEYMAPECLRGKSNYLSDYYSLGVILYEMIYGTVYQKGEYSELIEVDPNCYYVLKGLLRNKDRFNLT